MIKINKKIVSSSIALTLLPSVFTGCTMEHARNHDNSVIAEDKGISYDDLKKCYYIVIESSDVDKMEYYISNRTDYYERGNSGYKYRDLLTNKNIYIRKADNYDYFYWTPNGSARKFINEIRLEDYLYSLGMVKFYYTDDDIKNILEEMKKNANKELVKE